jgi:hypothetical protein
MGTVPPKVLYKEKKVVIGTGRVIPSPCRTGNPTSGISFSNRVQIGAYGKKKKLVK